MMKIASLSAEVTSFLSVPLCAGPISGQQVLRQALAGALVSFACPTAPIQLFHQFIAQMDDARQFIQPMCLPAP